jgi:hypothetical protein
MKGEKSPNRSFFLSISSLTFPVVPVPVFLSPLKNLAQPIFFKKIGGKLGINWEEKIYRKTM